MITKQVEPLTLSIGSVIVIAEMIQLLMVIVLPMVTPPHVESVKHG
nr:MAG TPA: hypothetical protein [Caudoviricetes sp.]